MRYILGEVGLPAPDIAHHKPWSGMPWGEKVSRNLKKITTGDSGMTPVSCDNLPSLHTPSLTENHPFTGRPFTEPI